MEDLRILDVSDPQQQAEEEPITSEKQVRMNKIVMDQVPKIGILGTWNQPKNCFKARLNQTFLHFLPNF